MVPCTLRYVERLKSEGERLWRLSDEVDGADWEALSRGRDFVFFQVRTASGRSDCLRAIRLPQGDPTASGRSDCLRAIRLPQGDPTASGRSDCLRAIRLPQGDPTASGRFDCLRAI